MNHRLYYAQAGVDNAKARIRSAEEELRAARESLELANERLTVVIEAQDKARSKRTSVE